MKKVLIMLAIIVITSILLTASAYANYTNYNSNNAAGAAPQIDAFNMYQVDAEAADPLGFGGGAGFANLPTFQVWNVGTWPYGGGGRPFNGFNGVSIPPGGSALWTFTPGDFPEVKWGVFRMHLILATNGPGGWGPAAPVDIQIEVDTIGQVQTTVWSAINGPNQYSVWNEIWIDFHLNQGDAGPPPPPTWLGQPWWGLQHTIIIANVDAADTLYLDEFHLTTAT